MRKNILVVLFLIAGLAGGTGIGFVITAPSAEYQKDEADYWRGEYYDLLDDYNTDLQALQDLNDNLFADLQALQDTFEKPLIAPVIPTHDEVVSWLYVDDTESYAYTSAWMCGDFAAMLMTRAKEMNWRMRIACMFWSYEGDIGWQDPTEPYGEYGHAFNVIEIQDYDDDGDNDWLYIEPQSDQRWFVNIFPDWYVHYEIWLTFSGGISGTVWSEPYFINHYSYFA